MLKPKIRRMTKIYDSDALMIRVWKNLARDFRAVEGHDYAVRAEEALDTGIKTFRDFKWPSRTQAPVHLFKREYQLENLFKRYRFTNDKFSDSELLESAINKFKATQVRVSEPLSQSAIVNLWLAKTRTLVSEILGPYVDDELIPLCKFGKRASVGNPSKVSYLDRKLSGPITGSPAQLEWFKDLLTRPENYLLKDVLEESSEGHEVQFQECNVLSLTNVAKSYKSLRSIMPNTLIGGFRSFGLGKMIEKRLKAIGLNIKNLQRRHANWVQLFSRTRTHVTADLSAASDSFSCELIEQLLPSDWYDALSLGRIGFCLANGEVFHLASFMTMGIGFTFPLQTLLFYCLLKALGALAKVNGLISVYGDDLIYPRNLHPFVQTLFPQIGFLLNKDKTFVRDHFRESCGSDYYRGCDVRPFQPEGSSSGMAARPYVLFLYKIINGLLRRWDKSEISMTYRFLLSEILRVDRTIFQVPMFFPDYSGIRTTGPFNEWAIPFSPVKFNRRLCLFQFKYYKLHSRERIVTNQYAYYWDALRRAASGVDTEWNPFQHISDSTTLQWKTGKIRKNFVPCIDGTLVPPLIPFVAQKDSLTVICQTGLASSWTEEG